MRLHIAQQLKQSIVTGNGGAERLRVDSFRAVLPQSALWLDWEKKVSSKPG
jgi:hypothetical protein